MELGEQGGSEAVTVEEDGGIEPGNTEVTATQGAELTVVGRSENDGDELLHTFQALGEPVRSDDAVHHVSDWRRLF